MAACFTLDSNEFKKMELFLTVLMLMHWYVVYNQLEEFQQCFFIFNEFVTGFVSRVTPTGRTTIMLYLRRICLRIYLETPTGKITIMVYLRRICLSIYLETPTGKITMMVYLR